MGLFVYVDTETTDKKPGQIAQLAYALVTWDEEGHAKLHEARNLFFAVDSVTEGAQKVHGFSKERLEELSGGLRFGDRLDDMWDAWYDDAVFTAHNAMFDYRFVKEELRRCEMPFAPLSVYCTMRKMTDICKIKNKYQGGYKWPTLEEALGFADLMKDVGRMAERLFGDFGGDGFHDARYDVAGVVLLHTWLRRRGL